MEGREDTIRIYTSQSYTKTKKAYQFMFIALGKYPFNFGLNGIKINNPKLSIEQVNTSVIHLNTSVTIK